MEIKSATIQISPQIGTVSGEITASSSMTSLMVLGHGAGAGMTHPFMVKLSMALLAHGIGTLRFNFPFVEQYKKRPDFPALAEKTVEEALQYAVQLYPNLPIVAGGKSFGGRMSSQLLSKGKVDFVKAIVFFGFPLHPAGKESTDRAEHLKTVSIPMIFLQGTRDQLAKWELIEGVCNSLPLASLVKIEGADHAFAAGKGRNVIEELAVHTRDNLTRLSIGWSGHTQTETVT